MNEWLSLALCLVSGYVLGSVPSAVWIGKLFFKKDVRQFGSGNAGATNTFRVLGKTAGTVVLIMDIAKGFVAVQIPRWAGVGLDVPGGMDDFALLCGLAAVVGHLYPVFARFKGGKGVATALGVVLAAAPLASLSAVGVFLVVWLVSGYVSLGSILSAVSFPVFLFLFFYPEGIILKIAALLLPLLIIYTHRSNIGKLMKGTENKTTPFKKKQES